MKTVAISYATEPFRAYQRLWSITGARAGFDEVRALGPEAIDPGFASEHHEILNHERGAGYWLWKPHLVAGTLDTVADGDVVFYSDAGTHFVNDVDLAVRLMDAEGLDLLILGEAFHERAFTKRDAFVLMECDEPAYTDSAHRFASALAVRRRSWTVDLVERWLDHCTDPRILTDQPNTQGRPDHPGFVAHRHDQSVLSLLTKRFEIPVPPNPLIVEGLVEPAGQLLNHTRTHDTPSAVLHRLLGWGVVGPDDVAAVTAPEPDRD